MERFIKIKQKDIVTNPEHWIKSEPGRFLELSNSAKNVYCVLSIISFSMAGSAKLDNGDILGEGWFWTTNNVLQKLTGLSETQVQKGQRELMEDGFIENDVDEASDDKRYIKLTDGESKTQVIKERPSVKGDSFKQISDEDQRIIDIVRDRYGEDAYIVLMNTCQNLQQWLTPEEKEKFSGFDKEDVERIEKELESIYHEEGYIPF
jgi:hypothetical protein